MIIIKCSLENLYQFENAMSKIIDEHSEYMEDDDIAAWIKMELKNEFKSFLICCANNADNYFNEIIKGSIEDEEI